MSADKIKSFLRRRYWELVHKGSKDIHVLDVGFGKIVMQIGDDVAGNLFVDKVNEVGETIFLNRVVQSHWNCVDVGANVGYFSVLLSKLASAGNVLAVEPIEENVKFIEKSKKANSIKNLDIMTCAVSDRIGVEAFFQMEDSAYSGLLNTERANLKAQINVETNTLENLVKKARFEKIDFIKIDVEGAEFDILRQAKDFLLIQQPSLIMSECNAQNLGAYGYSQKEMITLLNQLGYEAKIINGLGELENIHLVPSAAIDNVIFARPSLWH